MPRMTSSVCSPRSGPGRSGPCEAAERRNGGAMSRTSPITGCFAVRQARRSTSCASRKSSPIERTSAARSPCARSRATARSRGWRRDHSAMRSSIHDSFARRPSAVASDGSRAHSGSPRASRRRAHSMSSQTESAIHESGSLVGYTPWGTATRSRFAARVGIVPFASYSRSAGAMNCSPASYCDRSMTHPWPVRACRSRAARIAMTP